MKHPAPVAPSVWITGASGGIGEALAGEFARRGYRVALTARRQAELERVAAAVTGSGGEALVVPGDVCQLAAMQAAVAAIVAAWGRVDLLVANAGTHLPTHPARFDSAEYLGLMDLNYGGTLRAIEAVLPTMRAQGAGRIVGISSLAGYRGLPTAAAYGASKAALTHFLESLRFHLRAEGIGVCIVSPGFVKTPLTDKNNFHMPLLMSAPDAARLICRQVQRGRENIAFPVPFSTSLKLLRILPYWLYEFIIARLWHG